MHLGHRSVLMAPEVRARVESRVRHLSRHVRASIAGSRSVAGSLSALGLQSLHGLLLSVSLGQASSGVEASRSVAWSSDLRLFDHSFCLNSALVGRLRAVKVAVASLGRRHLAVADEAGPS